MTPRTLFVVILRVLGLLFVKDILAFVPTFFYAMDSGMAGLLGIILMLVFYGLTCYYLIFRADVIIERLRLDKGFNQEMIPINLHRSSILSIAVIVIGGVLVLNETPNFFQQLFFYFQEKRLSYGVSKSTAGYVILSGIKIVLGLFLMVGQRQIVNFIESQRKKK